MENIFLENISKFQGGCKEKLNIFFMNMEFVTNLGAE